ncbi:expressed unknown protein [Seminavis robusta]|uniref:Uncharacterized protein n=1 Tax=Seminavis robusta TaxID=568900 RepID=A0A9N8DI21_9STRA|nr:expressed unknown protein [Seminavis robusta]|eukprot:Sro95_g049390.1 n/a (439) ;mRNA; r:104682-106084
MLTRSKAKEGPPNEEAAAAPKSRKKQKVSRDDRAVAVALANLRKAPLPNKDQFAYELNFSQEYKSNSIGGHISRTVKGFAQAVASSKKKGPKFKRAKAKRKKTCAIPRPSFTKQACDHFLKMAAEGHPIFYSGTEERDCPRLPKNRKTIVCSAPKDLKVLEVDPEKGLHMPGVFTVVPQAAVQEVFWSKEHFSQFYSALDQLKDQSKNPSTPRGKTRIPILEDSEGTKYITVGTAPCRNKKGCNNQMRGLDLPENEAAYESISRLIRMTEAVAKGWIDYEALVALGVMKDLADVEGMPLHDGKKSKLCAAFAMGKNCYLNAHTDVDAFLSINMAIPKDLSDDVWKDGAILNYWCFPALGFCIPLRCRDILIFNPLESHCISSRCNDQRDEYNVTMYLKTAVVGGNDNSPGRLTTLAEKIQGNKDIQEAKEFEEKALEK